MSNHSNEAATVIKTEDIAVEETAAGEGVYHRKSKRRRVARDIFLVFEELPNSRRRTRGRAAIVKKSKFGHLKVENPTKKCLLRDIKNEPKCYLNHINNNNNNQINCLKTTMTKTNTQVLSDEFSTSTRNTGPTAIAVTITDTQKMKTAKTVNTQNETLPSNARVNPIFLWVKQDDTRIVEVRCEDYDKRNRIRLTKTTNGWQAIPRTDPASSRIVKFFQKPILTVKRELYGGSNLSTANIMPSLITSSSSTAAFHETTNRFAYVVPMNEINHQDHHYHENYGQNDSEWHSAEMSYNNNNNKNSNSNVIAENSFVIADELKATSTKTNEDDDHNYYHDNDDVRRADETATNSQQNSENEKRRKKGKNTRKHKKEKTDFHKTKAANKNNNIQHATMTTTTETAITANDYDKDHNKNNYDVLNTFVEETIIVSDSGLGSQEPLITPTKCTTASTTVGTEITKVIYDDVKSNTYQDQQQLLLDKHYTSENAENQCCNSNNNSEDLNVGVDINAADDCDISGNNRSESPELQLCPITGLFLRNPIVSEAKTAKPQSKELNEATTRNGLLIDLVDSSTSILSPQPLTDYTIKQQQQQLTHVDNTEVKNLKDLLDDAADDLLQHYSSDNANSSDADLIDSLVKRSCEQNLLQDKNENNLNMEQQTVNVALGTKTTTEISNLVNNNNAVVDDCGDNGDVINRSTVTEPPKCLSFNEAGEIEGINGDELFQSTCNLSDSFHHNAIIIDQIPIHRHHPNNNNDKNVGDTKMSVAIPPITDTNSIKAIVTALKSDNGVVGHNVINDGGIVDDDDITDDGNIVNDSDGDDDGKAVEIIDDVDAPRDLSYKKREEVCPPSESRSQCAVTSSSDIIKSPMQLDKVQSEASTQSPPPSTTAATMIDAASDTIKNFIYEQFIKMNTLTTAGNVARQKAKNSIDLGSQQHHQKYIDTVIIDDNNDEEPLKKRLRTRRHATTTKSISGSMINDKDPDPLTQLQLLIQNTQWKVPDPILVPKDRLSAVLASPAREIPLLITTRPELRLPEAFAHPAIIQNPNILVISMAQLEAILKNEMELDSIAKRESDVNDMMRHSNGLKDSAAAAQCRNSLALNNAQQSNDEVGELHNVAMLQLEQQTHRTPLQQVHKQHHQRQYKHSHQQSSKEQKTDSSLPTISEATFAMLNQLFWLPYFGQLTQEFFKHYKELPIHNQYNNNNNSVLNTQCNQPSPISAPPQLPLQPSLTQQKQFLLQNLDDLLKHCNKEMSNNNTTTTVVPIDAPPTPCYTPNSVTTPTPTTATFQNPFEVVIFQKLVEQQMKNLLHGNAYKTLDVDASMVLVDKKQTTNVQQPLHHGYVETKAKQSMDNKSISIKSSYERLVEEFPSKSLTHCGNDIGDNNAYVTREKYMGAGRGGSGNSFYEKDAQERDSKPRLTCKSLSNLLQPETQIIETTPEWHDALSILQASNFHHFNHDKYEMIDFRSLESNASSATTITESLRPQQQQRHEECKNMSELGDIAKQQHLQQQQPQRKEPYLNFMVEQQHNNVNSTNDISISGGGVVMDSSNAGATDNSTDALNDDGNIVWHPLFGSNAKPAYNSPWQWTTVTATGE